MTAVFFLLATIITKTIMETSSFLESFSKIIDTIDGFVWGVPLIVLLFGIHLFLTFRLKFIQRYIPLGIKLSITPDPEAKGDISQFGALSIALAATIGTGNIIGVATAIVLGGPGAVFWCWFCGVFGIATKYSEALLAIKYRILDKEGKMHGGPMYAIERGMNCKWLAVAFCVITIVASFGIGNLAQSNAVSSYVNAAFGVNVTWTGIAETILIAAVVLGGLKIISRLCEFLIPFMAILYVTGCILVLCFCSSTIIPAISLILREAFSLKSVSGGVFGAAIMLGMRYGIARGLFSNESGLGSAPIIAANAKTRNPVRQALISSTGTFWDTVIICALTGISQIAAILKNNPNPDFSSFKAPELAANAFGNIPVVGQYVLTVALVIFAYTTILGWFCYGSQAIHYLGGNKSMLVFRIIFVIMIFFGAISKIEMVWNISDIANGLMVIPNAICLLALSGILVKETQKYLWSSKDAIMQIDPDCVSTQGQTDDTL